MHGVSEPMQKQLQQSSNIRVADDSFDLGNATTAITGLFDDESNPLLSIGDAVACFPAELKEELKSHLWLGKQFVRKAETKAAMEKFNLDANGALAIFLYTVESQLYKLLNALLRSSERGSPDIKRQFFPYLRILVQALRAAAANNEMRMVNRGVKLDLVKLFPDDFVKGESVILWALSSCAQEIDVLSNDMFLGKTGDRTILQIHTCKGVDISAFSAIQSEAEVLLPPCVVLKIDGILNVGAGLTIIQCSDDEDAPALLS
jgi:hypothetical protein